MILPAPLITAQAGTPAPSGSEKDSEYRTVLERLNVTSLQQLRKVDTDVLNKVNNDIIQSAPAGQFPFGGT